MKAAVLGCVLVVATLGCRAVVGIDEKVSHGYGADLMGGILRVDRAGQQTELLTDGWIKPLFVATYANLTPIAVDETCVYWASQTDGGEDTGRVIKIAKPPPMD